MDKKVILFVFGTRPEVIKLAPVILELQKYPQKYEVLICNTEQQKELSNQTLGYFGLKADINLDCMRPNQSLAEVQSRILSELEAKVFSKYKIDATIVQGDTMTVLCGALVSFYNKIPVFHVEAGLRSYDIYEPFPEEIMRQMTSRVTQLHFAPTNNNKQALLKEGIDEDKIYITGNTVTDALFCLSDDAVSGAKDFFKNSKIEFDENLVLITVHRSPNVKDKVEQRLSKYENVHLFKPLDYPYLVYLMKHAKLILTDSGGIQEEAPTFGCPTLVMRYETERWEGIEAGVSVLVGADYDKIVSQSKEILDKPFAQTRLINQNPYGDGKCALKIEKIISDYFN